MELIGYIKPALDQDALDLKAWLRFCETDNRLKLHGPRYGADPFTGEKIEISFAHSFVMTDGQRVQGTLVWNETEIILRGDRSVMQPLAGRIVAAIDCVFQDARDFESDQSDLPPGQMASFEERMAYLAKSRSR